MAEQDEQKLDETKADTVTDTTADTDVKDVDDADKGSDNDEDFGISMDKVEAVLNKSADEATMTPQMRKMFARQQENTKRVEESIKGTKSNPAWFVPLFCLLLVIGLVWVVVYYMTYDYPIPHIGAWNLAIGFGIMLVGFLMTMWWR
ncbi:cell division protein CrgA [Bifidobacterium callimiconis]|uniref:Cell division protein CrgA n=1 Tax=Bifidobacterium callimiconis TaxID=2306973 RepID=A0A430F8E1_9BIFI|nr:cell division protein CrgA [Bifidobacterium callimiconis]MBT1177108.1 cell division protein CrgA [Bifidobacterium callimiconis]RSX49027.1 septation inhibitor protein [Bifidobacterium callimiconis]